MAIDVGNSQIELGLADASGWRARWRLETKSGRSADEYGLTVTELLRLEGVSPSEIRHTVISSVVPSLTPVWIRMCTGILGCAPVVVSATMASGLRIAYDPPASLGSDRLADAIAALDRYGAPVVVVDFGTATTFNVVDASGTFIGGAIAPGLGVAAAALSRSGARLRRFDLSGPTDMPVVGRDTAQSMRSGVVYGYAGLVSGLLRRIDRELADLDPGSVRATVVATGGMCRRVAPAVERIDHVEPGLTLDGLRLLHDRVQATTSGSDPRGPTDERA